MSNSISKIDFLEYFGLELNERNKALLAAACDYWGINDCGLAECIDNIERYHRADLKAIREILGVYILEWMSPFDSIWTQRIYFNVPGTVTWAYWIREMTGGETYVGSPDFISMAVLYGLFGRHEKIDTGNCRHCPVNLMRSDLLQDQGFPDPDIQISFGFTCDEAPKQDEIAISELGSSRLRHYTISNPVRGMGSTDHVRRKIRNMTGELLQDVPLYDAEKASERYRKLKSSRFRLAVRIHQIIDYVGASSSFRITNNDIVFLESLLITTFSCGTDRLESLLKDLYAEMKEAEGKPVRSRFCIYYTPICNPEYGAIMEQNGIALLDQTAFSSTALYTGKKDIYEDAAMEGTEMLIAGSADNEGRRIAAIIDRKDLDGFVSGMFAFDRWMGMQQHILRDIIEDSTDAEVFIYDTDFWNQESFNAEKLITAAETLACIMENKYGK